MLARVLVALAASVAAEKVKIGEIQTLAHAVIIQFKLMKSFVCFIKDNANVNTLKI